MRRSALPDIDAGGRKAAGALPGLIMRQRLRLTAIALAFFGSGALTNAQEPLRPVTVAGDSIPHSLTGERGDSARGRAIVINRQYTCLLCHSGPFPEERFQGDLSPDLTGTGSRWSEGQLRLRLVDASRLNPETIMPSYYKIDGLTRVGTTWKDKPILTAAQIEDIVAYLVTLRQ
jgi:sulfur-oxidizing protein SoxX